MSPDESNDATSNASADLKKKSILLPLKSKSLTSNS